MSGRGACELQRALTRITGTTAQIILSGNRFDCAPQLPGDGTNITFPYAREWLTEQEIKAVTDCLKQAVRTVCTQVEDDARRIRAALSTNGVVLFSRETRRFRLVVKESDIPCWLDEDDDKDAATELVIKYELSLLRADLEDKMGLSIDLEKMLLETYAY